MAFNRLIYVDWLKAAGFAEPQAQAMADLHGEIDLLRTEFRSELDTFKREFLAAMKTSRINFLKWFAMLIVGQTVFLAALVLLGY